MLDMLLFDNIFGLHSNGTLHKDKSNPSLHLVSHGHTDHLPSRLKNRKVMCTDETAALLSFKKSSSWIRHHEQTIQMFDAGHTLGSKMFYLPEQDLMYTGDFNTIKKYCGQAKPKKCSTLIIEATYGDERYIFPRYQEIVKALLDYVQDYKSCINLYAFGKAQEVCHLLNEAKIPFSIDNHNISTINKLLGLTYEYETEDADTVLSSTPIEGKKQVMVSGWALEGKGRMDAGFPLSDHADYASLISFIQKCDPDKIVTFHGFAQPFAERLRKAGYNAQALFDQQKNIFDF